MANDPKDKQDKATGHNQHPTPVVAAQVGEQLQKAADERTVGSKLAFSLVVIMLGILLILVTVLLVAPLTFTKPDGVNDKLLDYWKTALSVLLGAFGAWIGAGAAYFFGKENLAESSRSTEAALKLQQEVIRGPSRPGQIKDLALTAINKDFVFRSDAKKSDVAMGLDAHPDYWWVPVLDKDGNGTLADVIHARVLLDGRFDPEEKLSDIASKLDSDPAFKDDMMKLHGPKFFLTTLLDDKVADVSNRMGSTGAVVGVVVDDAKKPTYCFAKQNLLNVLK